MRRIFFLFLTIFLFSSVSAQQVVLTNDFVTRVISTADGHVVSTEYTASGDNHSFTKVGSKEFSFYINDRLYTGLDKWDDISVRDTSSSNGMLGKIISFSNPDHTFKVSLTYLTYPSLPLVRKFLEVTNIGRGEIKLEGVQVENIIPGLDCTHSYTNRQYARYKALGTYVGNWDDPLVYVYDQNIHEILMVGNEAIGVIKRTSVFEDGRTVAAGVTMPKDDYPFRRWLSQGESWKSAAIFTLLASGVNSAEIALNTHLQTYVRKYQGTRIEQIDHKPMFVYNTWEPFYQGINEKLIYELADAAAECGFEEFIIDDGWQTNNGSGSNSSNEIKEDWGVNQDKFPNGLKPVFDYIKSLGMKPGLWICIARLNNNNRSAVEHPEWFIVDRNGKLSDLHTSNTFNYTACLGTDWCDYIRETILRYVRDYGLMYAKLDLSIATSAYVYDKGHSGCYATNHPYHKDHEESFDVIYERCMKLFDELHKEAPELFIDCTFETAGKLQLMDYGISMHAEGNWLSNVGHSVPYGAMRVRNLAWGRTPALHPTSLVIGNMAVDQPGHLLAYKSLTGTLPIMLGDPRKLSSADRKEMKEWSTWMKGLEERHGIMSFRQDLPDFGEPKDGSWDGFCRLNTETYSGGLIGVFRQGAPASSRIVGVPWLKDDFKYVVKRGKDAIIVFKGTGKELREKGFTVTFDKTHDGELFEVSKVN